VISHQAAEQLYTVLKEYVASDRISDLLFDLHQRVDGNKSYRDTVEAMAVIHHGRPEKEGRRC